MRYIVFDLEATCWEGVRDFPRMETIEIGAVELTDAAGPHVREFDAFIRPIASPRLSKFCTDLTSIRQSDVDTADYFYTVFPSFIDWIGEPPFVICSWGGYDTTQFKTDCERHGMQYPAAFERHINLKKSFARHFSTKPCGMAKALDMIGLPLDGTHHRGIDDARNIGRIANLVLPAMELTNEIPGGG